MSPNLFDSPNKTLDHIARSAPPAVIKERITAVAVAMGDAAFKERVAREVVERTRPQEAIPDIYGHYRPVVQDGIVFFLSQVSRTRLVELAVSQLKMDPEANTSQRLIELAKQFPTLHKLGQIIARNPNIDPGVKKWLVNLENGRYGTSPDGITARIGHQIEQSQNRGKVQVHPVIYSEASVSAVVAFDWQEPTSAKTAEGVFKVLKPGIRQHLDEELVILEKTAAFFETHRERYHLRDFRFLDVFHEVREMLINEIDLPAEQIHLVEAARFYEDMDAIRVPQLLPLSTAAMTAMTYLSGPKITDAALSRTQRQQCAEVLFEALVCRPLFSRHEPSLFHGDPHAGNILAVGDPATGDPRIGLLDWSLAGRLTKYDRVNTAQLIQAVIKSDLSGIRRAVKALAVCSSLDSPVQRQLFRSLVLGLIRSAGFERLSLIKRTFKLLEHLTFEGFIFSPDLMLFRKAIFTLEGVLYDLWPAFDMDNAVTRYLADLMAQEIPKRFGNLFFPLADRPENYTSLISNAELQSLAVHQYIAAVRSGARSLAGCFTGWGQMLGASFYPPFAPVPLPDESRK